jgi:predicted amidohydrolase
VTSPALTVAVAQFTPTEVPAANRDAVAALVARAAASRARLVVFPEYASYFVDPFDERLAAHAEPLDGPFVTHLQALAQQHDVVVVAGLVESAPVSGKVRNTVVAVAADGVRAIYRKQHLYDAFGQRESDWIEPGDLDRPQTVEVDGVRVGLITCYDAGADLVLVPAEWVRGPLKEDQWMTLLRARAIENTVFVAAADHTPPIGVGHSAIVDPTGVVRASIGTTTGLAVAEVSLDDLARVRRVNPALQLRRYAVVPRPS